MLENIKAAIAAATAEQVTPYGLTLERFATAFNPQTRRDGSVQINIANLKSDDMSDTLKTQLLYALFVVLQAAEVECNISHASRRTFKVQQDDGSIKEEQHWVAWPCVWVNASSASTAESKKTQADVADLRDQVNSLQGGMAQILAHLQASAPDTSETKDAGTPVP